MEKQITFKLTSSLTTVQPNYENLSTETIVEHIWNLALKEAKIIIRRQETEIQVLGSSDL